MKNFSTLPTIPKYFPETLKYNVTNETVILCTFSVFPSFIHHILSSPQFYSLPSKYFPQPTLPFHL